MNYTDKLEKHEYTIKEELGQGSSAISFLVNSAEEDPYMVKEISYRDETNLDEIKEEVEILRSLNHPYIVDYEESFEDQATGHVYIVMEYCAGGDLYKKMQAARNDGVFEKPEILDWFVQICLALQYLHEKNILHRDIKPQNVFLTEDGYINLGDFGCSKVLRSTDVYAKSVVGSDLYVSPEVLAHKCDFKSDIWSLGWLLHDLCMPNVWSDSIERRCAHASSLNGAPPQISERYSEELRKLISQMLSCDPKDRPSADEILAKPFLKEAVKRNNRIPVTLKQRFMEATEIFEKTYKDSKAFLSEWKEIIDSVEEIHRKCTIGSLTGSVIGAAGGITALVGAILIPFTFGASLIVSGVGIGVGVAGGATSAVSNITNAVKQKALYEKLDKISQKYKDVHEQIFNSSETLRLLRKIQKFRGFVGDFDNRQDPWLVGRITFTLLNATKIIFLSVLANLGSAAARADVQAAEAVVAMAAVSGVLSSLLVIADAVFIGIDSREIHEMRQGEINDPEKIKSSVLKGIAQMRKMHKELDNILEGIKETTEALKQNY
ncbi:serine/threonine-protein kinase Nek2-like [Pimephales promelas]|uniref:serine/threonine-protein kinase Nek2-like n=1 Tax=Pimephales promelas TaxID=90988 RepID=UPI001955D1A0|nr:serine/threonine-protein kinase Nek2-like [Pimephales promelas]